MVDLLKFSSVAWVSLLLVGCPEKAMEPTDTGPEPTTEPTTAGTQGEPTTPTSETGATEPGATEPGATEPGATEPGATEPGATEPGATEPGATETAGSDTDTGTDTDTDSDTGVMPAECTPDPGVEAGFTLSIGDWPGMSDNDHEIDVMCTIDVMAVEMDAIEHALTCDDGGMPRLVTLRVPLPTGGQVTWGEGDAVHLQARRMQELDFGLDLHRVRMSAADETPLLMGQFGENETGPVLTPIKYTAEFPCGPEGFDEPQGTPFAVRFELGAETVTIAHGHRGVLPIEGTTEVFAIDLGEATTNYCCHFTRLYAVLVQRISPR